VKLRVGRGESNQPVPPRRGGFYGWRIVALAAVTLAASAPGQTSAVSAFIDPMMGSLGMGRAELAGAYLVGTLVGAIAMPWTGRALDRFGVRRTMTPIVILFGAALMGLAVVDSLWGVTLGFLGIRMLGQGALGLVATTAVALWFSRRRGLAVGIVLVVGSAVISMAPLLLERLIASVGWRGAWALEGLFVWALLLPIALVGMRDRPSDLGQHPDGAPAPLGAASISWGMTRGEAMGTPFFWIIAASIGVSALMTTEVAFHQIDLLGERGLGVGDAAANFLPQTVAALAMTALMGIISDRMDARYLLALSSGTLAAGLAWWTVVGPGWSAIAFGVVIGIGAGGIRALEAAVTPRYYGVAHLGSIRGVLVAIGVGASAFGPILFALTREAIGSYGPALLGGALVPLTMAIAALIVPTPGQAPVASARLPGPHRLPRHRGRVILDQGGPDAR
jgi:MFS family permease